MNNKGWGLQEMLISLLVLATALIISVILINHNFKKLNKTLNQNKPVDNNAVMSGVDQDSNKEEQKPEEKPPKSTPPEKKDYSTYQEIETDIIEAVKKYQANIYGAELLEGDKISVTITALVRENYLNEITDIKDKKTKCSGYATFIKENNNIDYKAYLKCGNNYQTEGYLSRLDDSE